MTESLHLFLRITYVLTNLLYYVHVHFVPLFPLITLVVNMMYLQIIYQREALQIPEMIW